MVLMYVCVLCVHTRLLCELQALVALLLEHPHLRAELAQSSLLLEIITYSQICTHTQTCNHKHTYTGISPKTHTYAYTQIHSRT